MTGESDKAIQSSNTRWWLYLLGTIFLVGNAVYRGVMPGPYNLPGSTVAYMEMGFSLILAVAILGMRGQVAKDPNLSEGKRKLATPLMLLALVAAVALFSYRFASVPGWYHGHLMSTPMPSR
ncbi:MAG: hypothetical protein H6898_15535 [Rhodobacter sp.]|nr:hypothetical protein [Paracoccaceae bacterium]MCC0077967.1 hypothetical protein [Rhodobacter sp.]